MPVTFDFGVDSLLNQISWFRQARIPIEAVIRSFLVECLKNQRTLELVSLKDTEAGQQDPVYLDVALQLRTDVLWLILGTDDLAQKAIKELRGLQTVMPDDVQSTTAIGGNKTELSVTTQLWRLAVAVDTVKVAAELIRSEGSRSGESPALKSIRVRQRLGNIEESYRRVIVTLRASEKWAKVLG